MKTPEQIKAWLKAQPWYEQFKENVFNSDFSKLRKQKTLSGESGLDTITGAFKWLGTPETLFFWEDVDKEFCKWYGEENPDRHND